MATDRNGNFNRPRGIFKDNDGVDCKMKDSIEQTCRRCGKKFTTFDELVELCKDCYLDEEFQFGDWVTTGGEEW